MADTGKEVAKKLIGGVLGVTAILLVGKTLGAFDISWNAAIFAPSLIFAAFVAISGAIFQAAITAAENIKLSLEGTIKRSVLEARNSLVEDMSKAIDKMDEAYVPPEEEGR